MSTFLVYDKVTENHWGVKYRLSPPPPATQPSSGPKKTPAAVQKVPGASPLMRPLKGPLSPSIDFSHSFSDKFELIIQCQAPGDVYFQHEGQLIHSINTPPTPSSLPTLPLTPFFPLQSLILHLLRSLPLLLFPCVLMSGASR